MKPKFTAIFLASHAAMILLGFSLAKLQSPPASSTDLESAVSNKIDPAPPTSTSSPGKVSSRAQGALRKSGGHEQAWIAVRSAKLTSPERLKVQRELLAKWADVDLIAAIEAAMGEAWDGGPRGSWGASPGPLFGVFGRAFARQPEESWELIRSKRFGVATGILRSVWLDHAVSANPMFVTGILGELSPDDALQALSSLGSAISGKPEDVQLAIFRKLDAYPDSVVSLEQLADFEPSSRHRSLTPEILKEQIQNLGETTGRTMRVKGMQFGQAIAAKPAAEIIAAVQDLPDAAVNEALACALVRSKGNAANDLALADQLARKNAWPQLRELATISRLQATANKSSADAVLVADWAAALPSTDETTEIFQKCMEICLRNDSPAIREWMGKLLPGERRDSVFAGFSQGRLQYSFDMRAWQWAVDQIADPALREKQKSLKGDGLRMTRD